MLSGRIDLRRAAQVVFGCFIIFGASTGPELAQAPPTAPVLPQPPAPPNAVPYDPYAGAALPPR